MAVNCMEKIRVAIVGCGGVHVNHARAIVSNKSTELVGVCDIVPARAEASSKEFGGAVMGFDEILGDGSIKSVHICTPHFEHAPIAVKAMEAGKMVMLEKPLAVNLSQAEEVLAVSQRTKAHFGVCFQNRYRPVIRNMYDLMRDGKLGKILGGRAFVTWKRDAAYYKSVNWRGSWQREGGSLLINQTIHTLDLLQWLFGGVSDVKGTISRHVFDGVIETEDTAELRLISNQGCPLLFYATTGYVEDSAVFIEVVAENARLHCEDVLTINWKDGRKEVITEEQASGPKAYWGVQHTTLINDFYDTYLKGEKFPIDASEAIQTMRLLDKIYNDPKINRCR